MMNITCLFAQQSCSVGLHWLFFTVTRDYGYVNNEVKIIVLNQMAVIPYGGG